MQTSKPNSDDHHNQGGTPRRKQDHVDLVVGSDVTFRRKTTGLERYEFVHNALPELDLEEIDTSAEFLGVRCSMPLLISSMTGGYSEAERINRELGEVCEELRIPMGIGSQRQAIENNRYLESFRAARDAAPSIPIFGNIGAAEVASGLATDTVRRLRDLVDANAFAVHLNPLQELMQPEGNPRFRGVLAGIERLVRELDIPVIVKEVGAGLSGDVVARLIDAGVRYIDVAGAGGTSWSGVEILRHESPDAVENIFWDWGLPTAEAIIEARPHCERSGALLIASGGIGGPMDMAVSIALGAGFTGAARPLLQRLMKSGVAGLVKDLELWRSTLRSIMFLSGAANVENLRRVRLRKVDGTEFAQR